MNKKSLLRKVFAISLATLMTTGGTVVLATDEVPQEIEGGGIVATPETPSKTADGKFEYILEKDSKTNTYVAKIYRYTGNEKNVVIPNTINGCVVTTICYDAFEYNSTLETVKIPDTVEEIGNWAFSECTNLKSITLPQSIKVIGRNAFSTCISLKEFTFPSTLEYTGQYVLGGCKNLETVTILSDALNEGTFSNCANLKKVVLLEGSDYIPKNCFSGCTNLEEVVFPRSLKYIGEYAFSGCSSLKELDLPNGLESISQVAFAGCFSLTEVRLPDSLIGVSESAFADCINLKTINIPKNAAYIGYKAFSSCYSLENIIFSENGSLVRIISGAFDECRGLKEIKLPESLTEIQEQAFSRCSNLRKISIPKNVEKIQSLTFSGCTMLEEVEIADGVKEICNVAFVGCSRLLSVKIPDSVATIDYFSFDSPMSQLPKNMIIFGNEGSYAQQYAENKDIKFAKTGTLFNISSVSSKSVAVGMKVTLEAKAIGGEGDCTYALMYKKSGSSTWTKIGKKYGTQSVGSFTPKTATTYDVMINVKDSTGKIKSKTFKVVVDKNLRNLSYLDSNAVEIGSKVTLHAEAAGGTGPYTYKMQYKKQDKSTWTTIGSGYSTTNTGSFRPKSNILYDVKINVKDSTGTVKSKTFVLDVYKVFNPDDEVIIVM